MLETSVNQGRSTGALASGSIEVTAMLGDSVVAVHHLTQPRGGRISSATKGLFAAGAFALLCAMGMFAFGVSVARQNQRALHDWTDKQGLPAVEFRARPISPIFDVLAIGSVATGLGMIIWGLSRASSERRSPYFRIGRGKGVELATDDAPAGVESFPIVAPMGDTFVFHHAPGMTGDMFAGGRMMPLAEVPQGMPLPDGARVRLKTGGLTILVSSVEAPRSTVGAAALDTRILGFAAGSAIAHAALLIVLFMIPDNMNGTALDQDEIEQRLVHLSNKPPEDARKLEEMKVDNGPQENGQSGKEGQAMKGPSGVMGSKDSKEKGPKSYTMKDNGLPPSVAKELAKERGANAGVLGVLRNRGGAFASIYSDNDWSSGFNDRDLVGGLSGPAGEQLGSGYGTWGNGPGGGGDGLHTIGTGHYGIIGYGNDPNGKIGYGSCRGDKCGLNPRREASVPKPTFDSVAVVSGIDKNLIRRYIRQHLAEIKYCYEKELVVSPGLGGTVNMQFTISGQGAVIAMKSVGVSDEVSSCVGGVVKTIQFPTDGAIVQVTSYPITFHPPGS